MTERQAERALKRRAFTYARTDCASLFDMLEEQGVEMQTISRALHECLPESIANSIQEVPDYWLARWIGHGILFETGEEIDFRELDVPVTRTNT